MKPLLALNSSLKGKVKSKQRRPRRRTTETMSSASLLCECCLQFVCEAQWKQAVSRREGVHSQVDWIKSHLCAASKKYPSSALHQLFFFLFLWIWMLHYPQQSLVRPVSWPSARSASKHWTLQYGADGVCLAADLSLHLLTRPVSVRPITSCFTFETAKQNLVVAVHQRVYSPKQGRIKAES